MKRRPEITSCTVTTALGRGVTENLKALKQCRSGLRPCDLHGVELETYIGKVDGVDDVQLPSTLVRFDCRNNRLTELGLQQDGFIDRAVQVREQYGAGRVGLFIGTSTSGIQQSEMAYRQREPETGKLPLSFNYQTTHDMYSCVAYLGERIGLSGPAQVISTACSSSAKVFAAAWRHMQAGFCDAAIVGGVDSLCQMTLYGFNSLQLVSSQPCRPADAQRDGINIGEAAGFALLEWADDDTGVCLLGVGESSDAWHMSSPDPEGWGAALAMTRALSDAGLSADDIDYIHLHGTATRVNDLSEDRAVMNVFGANKPCSSTKGFTGHTLGAAGIVGAVFSCLAIENKLLPVSLNTRHVDDAIQSKIILETDIGTDVKINTVMTNALGFGGTNACLILGSPT